ncbi:tail fiber assembly protein [Yersinia rochesterensis]|uniref:tail fiber assembly protein n=1 Tax=Yersinia rochesterensis TaxID=1604335 RepID=UPI0011A666F1|nr:tail fiber assembly protein [Yersinia rochesterensis]
MEQSHQPGRVISSGNTPAPKDRFGRPYRSVYSSGASHKWEPNPMTSSDAHRIKANELMEAFIQVTTLQAAVANQLATPEEMGALVLWETYLVLMNRVDPENPLFIIWPEKPEGGL